MTPTDYILTQLQKLKEFHPRKVPKEQLVEEIFRLIMSKKFRKYAASEELIKQIKEAIELNVKNNEPIKFAFPHGGYKLWRLQEAPLPDWAELFADMYYTKWLKPICEIYEPGVWFDYFVDDLILPKMNFIPLEHVNAYIAEERSVVDFLATYRPANFKMTVTDFQSVWGSDTNFYEALDREIDKLSQTHQNFNEEELTSVEFNAHPTASTLKDPLWRQKVRIVHDAYTPLKRSLGYYYNPEKIPVTTQPIASGKLLVVGTTKTSIAKFWVGVGALKNNGDNFQEYVLSPKQIEQYTCNLIPVLIPGLVGKNFKTIRVFE